MKTKLINVPSLYPDFTPYVSKYGDNGMSRTDGELKKDNISVEIVDLRTIFPLDEEIILKSIEKTSNLIILQEDVPFSSIASEVSSVVAEKGFWNLDNPIIKVTSPNTHIPFAPVLEDAFIPNSENLIKAIKELQ